MSQKTPEQLQAEDTYKACLQSGYKLAAVGLDLMSKDAVEVGKRLVKLGSTMMDGYALPQALPLVFDRKDFKFAADLCVNILEEEVSEIE
jgi:hypothetical protein